MLEHRCRQKCRQIINDTGIKSTEKISDTGVNISISDKAPSDYFSIALHQCETKEMKIGTITNEEEF